MTDDRRFKLLFGPYSPSQDVQPGDGIKCDLRGDLHFWIRRHHSEGLAGHPLRPRLDPAAVSWSREAPAANSAGIGLEMPNAPTVQSLSRALNQSRQGNPL